MRRSDLGVLLWEPVGTFLCYVIGSLVFSLVVDPLLPVGGWTLLGYAVVAYAVSARVMLASAVPSPPNAVDHGRERGVENYGKWEARRFVGAMLTMLLAVALAFPVFRAELAAFGEAAESSFTVLYYLGVVPTAHWASTRLTAQYLPSYNPDLYPDEYTRPLDEHAEE